MIKYFHGSVFDAPTNTYVNAVNCVGVMGAGIALEFKKRYPDMFAEYKEICDKGYFHIGDIYCHRSGTDAIINFPTKIHYKNPSKIEWIESGLQTFANSYEYFKIESVAFPALGCGYGGLNWNDVGSLMFKYLNNLDIDVYICIR